MIAGWTGRRGDLLLALAALSVTAVVLLPPEIVPAGRAAFLALAGAIALLLADRRAAQLATPAGMMALLSPLAAACVILAPCRARAVDEAAQIGAILLVGLLGFEVAQDDRIWRVILPILAVLGAGAGLQAILQAHWLYPQQAALLRAAGQASLLDNMIVRLESGRPSGPFILPAALAGFLAMTLPATAALARHASSRWARGLAALAALVQADALLLTRSLGGLAVAGAGLLLVMPALTHRRRAAGIIGLLAVAAVCALLFVHQRRDELAQAPGGDPLTLRLGNWRAASHLLAERPFFGAGPGSFGTAYTRVMTAGMNETRYAHNSYLQLMATWGIWTLLPFGVLLLAFARQVRRVGWEAPARAAVAAGAGAFLAHNLIDFTFYLPAVAAPAALLVGLALGGAPGERWESAAPSWRGRSFSIAVAILLAWNAGVVLRTENRMADARRAALAGDDTAALVLARQAAVTRPDSPEPWGFEAQLILERPPRQEAELREGEAAATRTLALDPEAAIVHDTRARYHALFGETASAYREEQRAHDLYPLKPQYREALMKVRSGAP